MKHAIQIVNGQAFYNKKTFAQKLCVAAVITTSKKCLKTAKFNIGFFFFYILIG
jgi:hypothetical protein